VSASPIPIYVDSSALAKLYVPGFDSDEVDSNLRGKVRLMISELGITEVLCAIARRKRELELLISALNSA
jgi:predicted nucleic acid-binding protein